MGFAAISVANVVVRNLQVIFTIERLMSGVNIRTEVFGKFLVVASGHSPSRIATVA
jgi:hypothetical protein